MMAIPYPNSGHFLSRWSSGLRGRGRGVGARRGTGDKGLGLLGFRFLLLPSKHLLSLFPFLGEGEMVCEHDLYVHTLYIIHKHLTLPVYAYHAITSLKELARVRYYYIYTCTLLFA